jgi:hypothetical protein
MIHPECGAAELVSAFAVQRGDWAADPAGFQDSGSAGDRRLTVGGTNFRRTMARPAGCEKLRDSPRAKGDGFSTSPLLWFILVADDRIGKRVRRGDFNCIGIATGSRGGRIQILPKTNRSIRPALRNFDRGVPIAWGLSRRRKIRHADGRQ